MPWLVVPNTKKIVVFLVTLLLGLDLAEIVALLKDVHTLVLMVVLFVLVVWLLVRWVVVNPKEKCA